jgi:uncharacterized membrane protein
MKRVMLLISFAVGYVLGAKAGRQRYDQIVGAYLQVTNDPLLREKASAATY